MAKQPIDDKELTPAQGAEGVLQAGADQPLATTEDLKLLIERFTEFARENPPEWVKQILDSNQAVIDSHNALTESNQSVIQSVADFKEAAAEFLKAGSSEKENPAVESEFDADSDYEVAPGKSFRDPQDFTKEYTEGDDVSHLPVDSLKRLLAAGMIEEA
jgi:hypothetical protein